MLKYLIVPLGANAISFCHYPNQSIKDSFTDIDTLHEIVRFSMLENLYIQFVYPREELPVEINDVVESVDHIKIMPFDYPVKETLDKAQIIVFDSWTDLYDFRLKLDITCVIRTTFKDLLESGDIMRELLHRLSRLNVVITDIESVSESQVIAYKSFLDSLIPLLSELYSQGNAVQFNLITDRVILKDMNNCNAAVESITVSPDGLFYICPGFYSVGMENIGSLTDGIFIKNHYLFDINHAPICKICDAYQCKRCVWLNQRVTREVNTPGRIQCLLAHCERNASKNFLENLKSDSIPIVEGISIAEIDYLDPLDCIINQ